MLDIVHIQNGGYGLIFKEVDNIIVSKNIILLPAELEKFYIHNKIDFINSLFEKLNFEEQKKQRLT